MEKVMVLLTFAVAMLSLLPNVKGAETANSKAVDKSKEIQQSMYAILRTMALPDAGNDRSVPVTQRFVLQVPGKLLNPMDYDPTNYTADVTTNRLSSFIPPVVEENMFRLTDIVPVAHPMKGGETGESFLDMYETVLNQLDVRGFNRKTEDAHKEYQNAIAYLADPIPDPENLTQNTTHLGMYVRLQKKYNDIRLDMENKIKEARDEHEDDPVKYQTWFQTHYPAMYANVENAYTEWLVFGQKDLVELYKAHLDVESQGLAVEEARIALRASGKVSLDRSSTVYPVYFEPSNWYEYLKAKPQTLSREQIQIKLGDIEAHLTVLESMVAEEKNETDSLTKDLKKKQDEIKKELQNKTSELNKKKASCMLGRFITPLTPPENDECQEFRDAETEIKKLSTSYANQKAAVEYAEFQVRATKKSQDSIKLLKTSLEAQKTKYNILLENAQTSDDLTNAASKENDTQDIQAGWMEFEFDSSTSSESEDTSSKSYAASLSAGINGFLWSASGGGGYSQAEQNFTREMKQANIKISAKILKVTIKRPWFKGSLFKLNDIMMRTDQKVSPGPMTEPDLITKLGESKFLLPQFANAFLLAKDVKMEFQGISSSTASHALQRSADAHLSGNYGPFSASSSFNYGSSESQLNVQSTADGLRISIPGAQVIGYYVTVLPCFPKTIANKLVC